MGKDEFILSVQEYLSEKHLSDLIAVGVKQGLDEDQARLVAESFVLMQIRISLKLLEV